MKIALYGATGMVGSRISIEALSRDHRITALSRHGGEAPAGAVPRVGNAGDPDDVARVAAEHDVVISAIGPSRSGDRPEEFLNAIATLVENVGTRRLVIVGGAGSLEIAPGLRLLDAPDFPVALRAEALAQAAALELLKASGGFTDWAYVSPPPSLTPGARTGHYRVGVNTAVGDSISAEDFAVAIVDEVERPRARRERFTVSHY